MSIMKFLFTDFGFATLLLTQLTTLASTKPKFTCQHKTSAKHAVMSYKETRTTSP